MATSNYFNNFSERPTSENLFLEDLIVESIQIMGHDVKYLPREDIGDVDELFGENIQSKFNRAYTMEMYLANVEGYEGDGDFFSKFGVEIRETSNFVIARRTFERYMPSSIAMRPREGDLIYVPMLQKIFEIKFVEQELLFYSLGKRNAYIYELRCEVFRYSQEDFNTGSAEIDDIENTFAYTVELAMGNGNGNFYPGEMVYQGATANIALADAVAEVTEWDMTAKKLQVVNVRGSFTPTQNVVGELSGAVYNLVNSDTLADPSTYDISDNKIIQDEATEFIDLSEINPFGVP